MNSEWHGNGCPICEAGTLHDQKKSQIQLYRGYRYTSEITEAYCNSCGESMAVFNETEELAWKEFRDNVDRLYANKMREWRLRLGLTQNEAAEISGGGVNAFSRYENGEAKPSVAAINLMSLLANNMWLLQQLPIPSGKTLAESKTIANDHHDLISSNESMSGYSAAHQQAKAVVIQVRRRAHVIAHVDDDGYCANDGFINKLPSQPYSLMTA